MTNVKSIMTWREECPACGSKAGVTLFHAPYDAPRVKEYLAQAYQGNVDVTLFSGFCLEYIECRNCTLIYQSNILNEVDSKLLYDKWINPDLAEKWHKEGLDKARSSYAQRLAYIHRKLGVDIPRLLDYGAGFGVFSEMAKKMGFDVTALEFSEDRRIRLEKKGVKTVGNVRELDGDYDFVNIDQVMEHLVNPCSVLEATLPLIQQNGYIYISVPFPSGLKQYLLSSAQNNEPLSKRHMLNASPLQHINCFSRNALLIIADRCGLKSLFSPLDELVSSAGLIKSVRDILRPFYRYLTTSLYFEKKQ